MTVTVYSGPGTSAYQSSQYTVTVNGSSAYVYGYGRTAPSWNTQGWSVGDTPYQSWVTWAADETVTVVVTRLAGAITSCTVYPTEDGITKSIVGSTVTLTVPANRRLQVEINGSKKDWLWLFSSPPITIPGGTTNWSTYGPRTVSSVSTGADTLTVPSGHGLVANERVRFYATGTYPTATGGDLTEADFYYVTNPLATTIQLSRTSGGAAIDITSAGSGTMQVYRTTAPAAPLYFPAGDWRVGRLFQLVNGQPVYFDGSAHVYGSLNLQGCTAGTDVIGHGVLKANTNVWENVEPLPFDQQLQWSAFYGKDSDYYRTNRIEGITVVGAPFYTFGGYEFSRADNVQILAGWTPNCDGFDLIQRTVSDRSAAINDCLSWCGDDGLKMDGDYLTLTVDNWYAVQSASSAVLIEYFGQVRLDGTQKTLTNIYARSLQLDIGDSESFYPTHCIVKAWVDASVSEYGAWDVEIDGLTVVGELSQPMFSLEVRDYPFGVNGALKGQVASLAFRNITVPNVPPLSRILGQDWLNTPHDIEFDAVTFDGVTLTAANFFDYFETNAYPYNITVEGHPVVTAVDISNTALDLIGHSKRITSIAPPDGSAEADACAEHYTDCVNELLDTHDWNFATVKRELVALDESDDPRWEYCYEMPASLLRVISIIPADAPDNHYTHTVAVPVDYEIHADSDDVVRIYTDLEDAWIRYVKYVTSPGLFSPTFLEALQWKLASRIAGPIIKGSEARTEEERCLRNYMIAMGRATSRDANQQRRRTQEWIAPHHQRR